MGQAALKNIAVITTSFPDDAFTDGQEAAGGFVYDFARALTAHARVTVIAPSLRKTREMSDALTIQRFAVPELPLSLLNASQPVHWPAILKTLRAGQSALREVVGETAIDHVVALWALPCGYWAYRINQEQSIPYSVWALGSDIWTLGRIPVVKTILGTVLRQASHRFADGYLLANDVKRISDRECRFLPSSRDLAPQRPRQFAARPPYKLAYLGRWHHNKGIDLLLDSLSLLGDDDWAKIEAVRICGGGPLQDVVREKVEALLVSGRSVTLRGYLNKEAAGALLAWADYVLLPSRIESIPVIFSDAMQSACPVITMPVGDLPRLAREYATGIVAESVSADGFKIAIQKALITAPAHFQQQLDYARQQFSVTQSAKELSQIF